MRKENDLSVSVPKLKKDEFELPFPKKDPFIISVDRYGGPPDYRDIMVNIGVKSNKSDYGTFSGWFNEAVLFKIGTYYLEPVPFKFAKLVWEKFYLYLYKYQDKAHKLIKNNHDCFNGFSKEIKLSYYFKKNKLYYYIDNGLDELVDLDKYYPELVDIYDSTNKDYMHLKYYRKFIPTKKEIDKCLNGIL